MLDDILNIFGCVDVVRREGALNIRFTSEPSSEWRVELFRSALDIVEKRMATIDRRLYANEER